MVRCKFVCESKTLTCQGASVVLVPVTRGSKENEEFFKYTPFGKFEMGTINPVAAEQLEPGKEYYIDISPVPKNS